MTSGLSDAAAWWSSPGRPGMTGQSWFGTAFPRTIAGLSVGAWSVDLARRVEPSSPFPGVLGASPSLAAYDSIGFSPLAGASSEGYQGTMATAIAVPADAPERRTRGIVHFSGGSFGFDDNALAIERGDSLNWTRAEVATGSHLAAGSLDRSGHHLWHVATQWARGAHRVEGGFGHRGSALLVRGGEEEAARGGSGYLRYRNAGDRRWWGFGAERGYDVHESFGGLLSGSRRDAQTNRGDLGAGWRGERVEFDARFHVAESEVRRLGEDDTFVNGARWAFGSSGVAVSAGPGRIEASVGAGRHGAFDALDVAPSLSYRIVRQLWSMRTGVKRALWAVWSDLEPAEAPFLQSTWAIVWDASLHGDSHAARGFVIAGRSRDRALVPRLPIEELWLREGFRPDPDPYTFTLVGANAEWRHGRWDVRGEGFALARSDNPEAVAVDPGWGMRAEAGYRMSFFEGDLAVNARAGAEAVGARDSEGLDPRTLPAYVTSYAAVAVTLADAVIALRVRNLEDVIREETWLDTATLSEAVSAGREFRFMVTLKLAN